MTAKKGKAPPPWGAADTYARARRLLARALGKDPKGFRPFFRAHAAAKAPLARAIGRGGRAECDFAPGEYTAQQLRDNFVNAAAEYGLQGCLSFVPGEALASGAMPKGWVAPAWAGYGPCPWRDVKAGMRVGRAVGAALRDVFSRCASGGAHSFDHYESVRAVLRRLAKNRARKGLPPREPADDELAEALTSDLLERLRPPAGGKAVLSCNLLDVLTMSCHAAFTSCHDLLKESAHRSGPLQLALDGHTAVAYFYREGRTLRGVGRLPYKLWRQLVHFDLGRGSCTFVRQYPGPRAAPPGLEAALDSLAAATLNRARGEKRGFLVADPRPVVGDRGPELCYVDDPVVHNGRTLFLLGREDGPSSRLDLAPHVPCPACGVGDVGEAEELVCDACAGRECSACGAHVPRDEVRYWPNRKTPLCQGCFDEACVRCHHCAKYKPREGSARCEGSDWCKACAKTHLAKCHKCSLACPKDDSRKASGRQLCRKCFAAAYFNCRHCGKACETRPEPHAAVRACLACYAAHWTSCAAAGCAAKFKKSWGVLGKDGRHYCAAHARLAARAKEPPAGVAPPCDCGTIPSTVTVAWTTSGATQGG